tara:strand:- start:113 stop:493 length:381 start_codon:yes stop_codon:yes gene_type:complete
MRKLLLALLFTIGVFNLCYAEHEAPDTKSPVEKFNFWWEQVPAVCSTSDEIERWAEFKKFNPINISFGREGGSPDGRIVYIVVYWMNEDQESFASVSTPERPDQACIVFRTFDLKLNTTLLNKKDI